MPKDPDDPRDDGPESENDASPLIVALIGIAVGVVVVLSVIGIFVSRDPKPAGAAMCTETCWGFLKLECPTNRVMGACFGWPSCGGTPHTCGSDK
jgi:hypothetical protein